MTATKVCLIILESEEEEPETIPVKKPNRIYAKETRKLHLWCTGLSTIGFLSLHIDSVRPPVEKWSLQLLANQVANH
ncbi:hypothetical protein ACTXT7_013797 [Hymenolepis weldensis]